MESVHVNSFVVANYEAESLLDKIAKSYMNYLRSGKKYGAIEV